MPMDDVVILDMDENVRYILCVGVCVCVCVCVLLQFFEHHLTFIIHKLAYTASFKPVSYMSYNIICTHSYLKI